MKKASEIDRLQNDGSSSGDDDESPEVVSSAQMKSEREKEIRELFAQKQKLKQEAKEKRRQKLEQLKLQKKAKLALLESQQAEEIQEDPVDDLEEITTNLVPKGKHRTFQDDDEPAAESPVPLKKTKKLKRVYPKYNIEVEPLTRVQDPRAAAAISFKEKRLAKVPREKCASTILSYREKLLARNK